MNSVVPSPFVSQYPFEPVDGNLFPPVCLKSHWDPTQMLRHILPQQRVALPLDFRPWTKICKNYVTSAPQEDAPLPPSNMVFPTGGSFYPPGRYSAAIDEESVLRTLNQRLNRSCPTSQYVPSQASNMYIAGSTVPDRPSDALVSELAMPAALLRVNGVTCRSANDSANFQRSGRLFHNPTKQDRYGVETQASPHPSAALGAAHSAPTGKFYPQKNGLPMGEPMMHGGVYIPVPTASAVKGRTGNFASLPGGEQVPLNPKKPMVSRMGTLAPHEFDKLIAGTSTAGSAAPVW
jgi:hypothetical protein